MYTPVSAETGQDLGVEIPAIKLGPVISIGVSVLYILDQANSQELPTIRVRLPDESGSIQIGGHYEGMDMYALNLAKNPYRTEIEAEALGSVAVPELCARLGSSSPDIHTKFLIPIAEFKTSLAQPV